MKNSGLRPWRKGQSGNPSGRPGRIGKLRRELLKLKPKALKALEDMLESENDRLAALKLWLSYCYGPPPKEEEHEDRALPFFQPLTPEQKAFAEHMIKTLPEGETAGDTAEAMSPGGA